MNDFTKYDAYINNGSNPSIPGLIAWEDEPPQTQNLPPRPARADTGIEETRFEARSEYGDWFAQGDFSGGAEQIRYHTPKRDETKFYWSEGVDISKPGRLRLLHDTSSLGSSDADVGHALEIADGQPFMFKNDVGTRRVYRLGTSFPLTETAENPFAAEGEVNITDLASSGEELYVALASSGGIHKRDTSGVYTHYVDQPTSSAWHRIEWLRNRLIAVDTGTSSAGARIYEITAGGAAPSPIETLPFGWTFEAIWEYGPYIYAAAVHLASGRCNIHHYGLNQAVTALEAKGFTPMPHGQLVYSGTGYLGVCYLGGGLKNKLGGLEPFVYQAVSDAQGFLSLAKLVEREASSSSSLPVRCFEPYGASVYFGWTLGSAATLDSRVGLAVHHLDRDAFAHHLAGGLADSVVTGARVFLGRLVYVVEGDRVYYENVGTYPALATDTNYLITSVADWNNAGQKIWDMFEVSHSALASSEEVRIEYITQRPDLIGLVGTEVILSNTVGAEGKVETLTTNVKSRQLTLKLRIKPNTARTSAPEIYAFAVRSVPAPATKEYVLTRAFRILDKDRKDENAPEVRHEVDVTREALQDLVDTWITFSEAGQDWTALVTGVADVQPLAAKFQESTGEEEAKGYVLRLQMIARRA